MLPSLVTAADLHALVPEIFLCGATFALLMTDLFLSPQRRALTHFLALMVLVATALLTVRDMAVAETFAFSHMFVRDVAADVLKIVVYAVAALSFVYAKPYLQERDLFKGEFYVLCLFAVLGMMLMISAASLVTLYLGLFQCESRYSPVDVVRNCSKRRYGKAGLFSLGLCEIDDVPGKLLAVAGDHPVGKIAVFLGGLGRK